MTSSNQRAFPTRFISILIVAGLAVALFMFLRSGNSTSHLKAKVDRQPVHDFTVSTLAGKQWQLSAHKGQVVLINVFATWCPPCNAEMPNLVKLSTEYAAKGVETMALSVDEGGPDLVKKFVDKYQIPFPVAMADTNNPVTSGVTGIPVTILIDREGKSASMYVGMISEDAVRHDFDSLLAEK